MRKCFLTMFVYIEHRQLEKQTDWLTWTMMSSTRRSEIGRKNIDRTTNPHQQHRHRASTISELYLVNQSEQIIIERLFIYAFIIIDVSTAEQNRSDRVLAFVCFVWKKLALPPLPGKNFPIDHHHRKIRLIRYECVVCESIGRSFRLEREVSIRVCWTWWRQCRSEFHSTSSSERNRRWDSREMSLRWVFLTRTEIIRPNWENISWRVCSLIFRSSSVTKRHGWSICSSCDSSGDFRRRSDLFWKGVTCKWRPSAKQ